MLQIKVIVFKKLHKFYIINFYLFAYTLFLLHARAILDLSSSIFWRRWLQSKIKKKTILQLESRNSIPKILVIVFFENVH